MQQHHHPHAQPFGYQQQPFGAPSPNGMNGGWTSCPRCQSPNIHRPTYTWWGGILGPALFKHAICRSCSLGFNYKTGKSNATAIGIYFAVIFVIAIAASIASAAAR